MKKEIEVKFHIDDYKETLTMLQKLFGRGKKEWFERTYGFFTQDDWSWKIAGIFPRIKEINTKLVFGIKVRPKKESSKYFEREELEYEIQDKAKYIKMLKMLGYSHIVIFEKYRKEWKTKNAIITLDRLPFGNYIEIESTRTQIEKLVKKLKLKKRITKAYLGVWQDMRKENDSEDAIF